MEVLALFSGTLHYDIYGIVLDYFIMHEIGLDFAIQQFCSLGLPHYYHVEWNGDDNTF